MARRKTIGVLTFHKCINYGSYWQARCLVEGLRARGFDAELLDHDCASVRRAEARCALQPNLPERTRAAERRDYAAKTRTFASAIAALPHSRRFALDAPECAEAYDAIVVGSDEVWNFRHPWYGSKPIFFGEGLKAERLVSYAASFGNHSAWDGIDDDWASKLGRFASLSVRDQNSWHLVRDGTGREPAVVLDPVLQFPESIDSATAAPSTGRYAVIYGHGFPQWLVRRLRRWAERTGTRLISLGYSNTFADEQKLRLGPVEFASMIGGARAVITNFFHGCVFAILSGKPWASAPSDYRSIKIPDLAKLLSATNRIVGEETSDSNLADLLSTPIQPHVASRLDEYRDRSENFLNEALG